MRVRTDTLQHLTTENVLDLVDTLVARIVVQTLSAVVGVPLVSVGTGHPSRLGLGTKIGLIQVAIWTCRLVSNHAECTG